MVLRLPQSGYEYEGRFEEGYSACPIEMGERTRGVLYHDNTYSQGIYDLFDQPMLIRIAQNVRNYIMRIQEYSKQIEDKSCSALRETMGNEQSEGDEIQLQSRIMRELLGKADRRPNLRRR